VSVKGVAERPVEADLAIWPLGLVAADNDLGRAQAQLQSSLAKVRAFLVANQVDTAGISLQDFSVSDAYANQYGGADRAPTRYVVRQTIVVRSSNPRVILAASQRVGDLVSAGVVISGGGGEFRGGGGPTFVFTKLNDLKPQMIADATARAREAAEQFAVDSRSSLAGIRSAYQGVFEILPRDQAEGLSQAGQILKTVRVVSTIDYLLKN
jgi:hypothetical protein